MLLLGNKSRVVRGAVGVVTVGMAESVAVSTRASKVVGLAVDDLHRFSKPPVDGILLVRGHGVLGDAHAGEKVQHRSRVARDPDQPNLRQVHLLHAEFLDLARRHGFDVAGGDLGENILTRGLDVLALPRDTRLHIGPEAVVRVTGLRNPCRQIDDLHRGLLKVALGRDDAGEAVRRAGVMGVVEAGGRVHIGDAITAVLPAEPHVHLEPV